MGLVHEIKSSKITLKKSENNQKIFEKWGKKIKNGSKSK